MASSEIAESCTKGILFCFVFIKKNAKIFYRVAMSFYSLNIIGKIISLYPFQQLVTKYILS